MTHAEQAAQAEADARHGGEAAPRWRVSLSDGASPEVVLRAKDRAEAVRRYKDICGVISSATPVHAEALDGPAAGDPDAPTPAAPAADNLS